MKHHSSSFQIGEFRCAVLVDGQTTPEISTLPDRFPAVAEKDLLHAARQVQPGANTLFWSMNTLLIQSDHHTIVVDTGIGPRSEGHSGQQLDLLKTITDPEEVDAVIITHCHGDHIGGLVDLDRKPIFPNADVFMWKKEWEHWMGSGGVVETGSPEFSRFLREKLNPFQARLRLFEDETPILPGISPIFAPGHTPGHIGLWVESREDKLMVLSDTLHAEVQLLHPEWSPRYDTDPSLSSETRSALLDTADDEACLTLIYHFQAPGLGVIRKEGSKRYSWVRMEEQEG